MSKTIKSSTPNDTFEVGEKIGGSLRGGEVVLLFGGLGAGKTLLTKGILHEFGYDIDEVTSPSFTLVNLYKTPQFDVHHIDLWRLDGGQDIVTAIGLDEILEDDRGVTIIEWAERLGETDLGPNVIRVSIDGDGDQPRTITIGSGRKS